MTPLLSFYYSHYNNISSSSLPPVPLFPQCLLKPGFPAVQKHLSYLHIKDSEDPVNELLGGYLESWFFEIVHTTCPCCPPGFHWCSWGQTGEKLEALAGINSSFWCIAGYDPEISIGGNFCCTLADVRRCVLSYHPRSVWSLLNPLLAGFVALPTVSPLGEQL